MDLAKAVRIAFHVAVYAIVTAVLSCKESKNEPGNPEREISRRRAYDGSSSGMGQEAPAISNQRVEVPEIDPSISSWSDDRRREYMAAWILDCLIRNPSALSTALRSEAYTDLLTPHALQEAAQKYYETYPGSFSLFQDRKLFDDEARKSLFGGILSAFNSVRPPPWEEGKRNLVMLHRLMNDDLTLIDTDLRNAFQRIEGVLMSGSPPEELLSFAKQLEPNEQEQFVRGLVSPLSGPSGAKAVGALIGDPPAYEPEGFELQVLDRWLRTVEPKVALEFLDPNADFYRERRVDHFRKWLTKDSVGASDWMRRNMDLPDRDHLGKELVEFIERAGNPEDADAWREALGIAPGN